MRHFASVALWALTAFGIILVAASALGSGDAAWAQQPEPLVPPIASADAPPLKFEAASVKAAAPADRTVGTLPVISPGPI